MLFVKRVVEVVSACERVDFAGKLAYVSALLFEIGGPPSFLVRGWFGAGYVFFDSSVDGVFEVLEGHFEFGDIVKGVRDGELVKFCFYVLDEVVPFYFSPIISRGGVDRAGEMWSVMMIGRWPMQTGCSEGRTSHLMMFWRSVSLTHMLSGRV